jgi:hypothetical protein
MADIDGDMFDGLSSHRVFGILGEQEEKEVMQGDVFGEHALKSKVIRIFLCSTFTDTQVERNVLMREIYPKLKEYCHSLGLDFQIVDLRWGIRDEAVDEHLVPDLCLQEIKLCQEISIGPQFVVCVCVCLPACLSVSVSVTYLTVSVLIAVRHFWAKSMVIGPFLLPSQLKILKSF